jgi:hypothetical protein
MRGKCVKFNEDVTNICEKTEEEVRLRQLCENWMIGLS